MKDNAPLQLSSLGEDGIFLGGARSPIPMLYDYKTGDTYPTPSGAFERSSDNGNSSSYKEALVLGRLKPEEVQAIIATPGDFRKELGEVAEGLNANNAQSVSLLIDMAQGRDELMREHGIEVIPKIGWGVFKTEDVEMFNPAMTDVWFEKNFRDKGLSKEEIIPDKSTTPYEAYLRVLISSEELPVAFEYRGPSGKSEEEKDAWKRDALTAEIARVQSLKNAKPSDEPAIEPSMGGLSSRQSRSAKKITKTFRVDGEPRPRPANRQELISRSVPTDSSQLFKILKESPFMKGKSEDYVKDWWGADDVTIVNFIGKDNIIFHSIIFPVMCLGTGFVKPVTQLPANQYVNLEGKQFSKSKGWYVDADDAIARFGSDALRFYLTSLIPETADSSFTWKALELKINSELANNIGNFVNRAMKFSASKFSAGVPGAKFDAFFTDHAPAVETFMKEYHELLDSYQIKRGQEHLMALGSKVNQFITERAPWTEFKADPEKALETIAISTAYVFVIGTFFAPYLPQLSGSILAYFGQTAESELVKKVYQGDLGELRKFFSGGFKLRVEPQGLVPKIDSKLIEELDAKLKEKASS
jgi:hypothetical protein